VLEDARWNASRSATAAELAHVRCPVAVVRAAHGFTPEAPPLIDATAHRAMQEALDLRVDLLLEDATHYTMMMQEPFAREIAAALDSFVGVLTGGSPA
jgi:hypothetical protein